MKDNLQIDPDENLHQEWASIFISYSRKNLQFVREIALVLEKEHEVAVYMDVDDILPTEEWEDRIKRLIEQADAIVLCISKESVSSEVIAWELEYSRDCCKRILPLLIEDDVKNIPKDIAKINFIYCCSDSEIKDASRKLVDSLKKNIEWIRECTRLSLLAFRWKKSGKLADQLLLGQEIVLAKTWLKDKPTDEQSPHPTTLEYIHISDCAAIFWKRKQKIQRVIFYTLEVLLLAGGVIAIWLNFSLVSLWTKFFLDSVWNRALSYKEEQTLVPGETLFQECFSCPVLVVIQPGNFVMGWADEASGEDHIKELPLHTVNIDYVLAVSRDEITFDEWDACVLAGACSEQKNDFGWGRGKQPIVFITWDEAKKYTEWLSSKTGKPYRLLSESEWEYVARAGDSTMALITEDTINPKANCTGCGSQWDGRQPAPVGMFPANAFGVRDMLGNVWEWVLDCQDDYNSAPCDGSPRMGNAECVHVVRGLSFNNSVDQMHPAYRGLNMEVDKAASIGFRVARVIKGNSGHDNDDPINRK